MGSSKKHKERDREHKKKKKHRSRSRSRSREKKRRREDEKRRHKERRSPSPESDNGEVEVRFKEEIAEPTRGASAFQETSGGDGSSLSIEQTNRIRSKLGLKPLDVGDGKVKDENDEEKKKKEDVHVPAVSITQMKKTEKLKERIALQKERRAIQSKLNKVKTLGDSDSDDESATAWVKKSRQDQRDKAEADKRAKMLEEMDQEFGFGSLVEEEFGAKKPKNKGYSSRDLAGMQVDHDLGKFSEGKTVIMTLKDRGVLEEEDDTLINVNIIDDEKAEENTENKKKKPTYNPYEEGSVDEYGFMKEKEVLSKYADEKEKSFKLGSGGKYLADHERRMKEYKAALQNTGETLSLPPPMIASAYYTDQEMATFNKVKKKNRKIRKKPRTLKANDLLPFDGDSAVGPRDRARAVPGLDLVDQEEANMDIGPLDDTEAPQSDEDLSGVVIDDEMGNDLEQALNRTRRLRQRENRNPENIIHERLQNMAPVKEESDEEEDEQGVQKSIVLNATSEFCRALGDIPTYGQAGNRQEEEDELLDYERELQEQRRLEMEMDEEGGGTGWQSVEVDNKPVDIKEEVQGPLEEEPVIDNGIAGALELARKKGLLEEESSSKRIPAPALSSDLAALNYSIEDKRYDDIDEKYRKRDRFTGGATQDFKDLSEYKPDVKLEYVDETGRSMTPKEAFRQLSHRFHGKGSGKKKTEKRAKQHEQEQLLKTASSSDTPLGTVEMMRQKQLAEKTPFVVLSGGSGQKSLLTNTISK